MKNFKSLTTAFLIICLICLAFPHMAHALTHGDHSFTLPQLLVFGLVLGWYLVNHFKPWIRERFKKNKQKPE